MAVRKQRKAPAKKAPAKKAAPAVEESPAPVKRTKKVSGTHVNVGGRHVCNNGQVIEKGQCFTPSELELSSFGDKFQRIEVYEASGTVAEEPASSNRVRSKVETHGG